MSQEKNKPGPATVLIVDDEEDIVIYLVTLLSDHGLRAIGAGDSASALEAIRTVTPDLILLDIMMPGRSGLSLYHALRRSQATARVPILFISGCCKPEELKNLAESQGVEFADVSNYLEKPIPVAKLLRRVQELLHQTDEGAS